MTGNFVVVFKICRYIVFYYNFHLKYLDDSDVVLFSQISSLIDF